jgi:hypothetical protein
MWNPNTLLSAEHALILRNTIMVSQFLANLVVFVRNFARNLTAASSHLSIAGWGCWVGPSLHGISETWVVYCSDYYCSISASYNWQKLRMGKFPELGPPIDEFAASRILTLICNFFPTQFLSYNWFSILTEFFASFFDSRISRTDFVRKE